MKGRKKFRLSTFQTILLGFIGAILVGAVILCLPVSSEEKEFTPFFDALFTATSAVCVTGLVVYDTATHWSVFGQVIILLLIQIGGLGVITVAASIALLAGRKIGLFGRDTLKEAISAPNIGETLRILYFLLKRIFIIEAFGALVMMPVFCRDFGWEGVWLSIFHSVSAFCNAGFDLMGAHSGYYSSVTGYASNVVVNLTLMFLIVSGGIGFLAWHDIEHYKWRVKKYSVQSKVVLVVSAVLILVPAIYFFFGELEGLPFGERTLASLFQSVTCRTAGFNTADISSFSDVGITIMTVLMLIGGSPGSTAGGMKTTTVAVLFASALSVFGHRKNGRLFSRRVEDETVKHATAILFMYILLFLAAGAVISKAEGLPVGVCLFEAASAIGTVGLTLGITPGLGVLSKIILMFLMYFGRVGGLTIVYAALGNTHNDVMKLPPTEITVG